MIAHLHPTAKLLEKMSERGTYWPDVESDLLKPETVTPVEGSRTRLRVCGVSWQGYVEPGKSEGHWVLVGVRPRDRAEEGTGTPVVGVPVRLSMPRSSGGSGRRWPSSWSELQGRLIEQGYRLEQGRTHIGVYDQGRRVSTLPVTSSDHRALVNACTQLRREAGIDVRR
ncbi:putative helicase [Streptomyces phage Endor1]|uniref:Putative helicase n=1 Tax=Streptomyces phage Endor1 TaxID=2740181 RepID=A0A7G4AWY5_9CAUD|nr:putative helicase [Streptomyces phage Endor1]QMP84525.1 putative helicase [Streptomyces phage Endor1]